MLLKGKFSKFIQNHKMLDVNQKGIFDNFGGNHSFKPDLNVKIITQLKENHNTEIEVKNATHVLDPYCELKNWTLVTSKEVQAS